jgi:hypothetical protein
MQTDEIQWLREQVGQLERDAAERESRLTELLERPTVENATTEQLRDELRDRGWKVDLHPL